MLTHVAFIYLDDLLFLGLFYCRWIHFLFFLSWTFLSTPLKMREKFWTLPFQMLPRALILTGIIRLHEPSTGIPPVGQSTTMCPARFAETNLFAVIFAPTTVGSPILRGLENLRHQNGVISRACRYFPERLPIRSYPAASPSSSL